MENRNVLASHQSSKKILNPEAHSFRLDEEDYQLPLLYRKLKQFPDLKSAEYLITDPLCCSYLTVSFYILVLTIYFIASLL